MTSTTVALRVPLKLKSPSRWIRPDFNYEDYSAQVDGSSLQKRRESLLSTITLQDNKELQIEHLFKLKTPLIDRRNEIIKNPIKLLFLKQKLKAIDAEIDKIELEIYKIQSKDITTNESIDNFLNNIEDKLNNRIKRFQKYREKSIDCSLDDHIPHL
ncbi:hypothetical protein ACD661_13790 [Legionella lytica]|uniref:Uncharacterized protein n=1 Tax=Legionella lytica TaxID=96232 RepID=A0ABW8DA99_9GAMM